MHLITVLRDYMGMTQMELAKQAGFSQCDLSEMETRPPYGQIMKYQRLSKVLGVPVHALVTNNYKQVPNSFFDLHDHAEYINAPSGIGRAGEEAAFAMEQDRLAAIYPNLSKLVIPYYKQRLTSPGYDILSFDDEGSPIYIEVKTTICGEEQTFSLTSREHDTAQKLTAKGERYFIYRYTHWDSPAQTLHVIPFQTMLDGARITPGHYICAMKDRLTELNGLVYWRRMRGIQQDELAKHLGIRPHMLCLYERGERRCPVVTYRKIAELLDVSIDDLLNTYSVHNLEDYEQ